MKKNDPCVNVCQFDGRTGWCRGCGRTVAEIKVWQKIMPYRHTALARELQRRVARLAETKSTAGKPSSHLAGALPGLPNCRSEVRMAGLLPLLTASGSGPGRKPKLAP